MPVWRQESQGASLPRYREFSAWEELSDRQSVTAEPSASVVPWFHGVSASPEIATLATTEKIAAASQGRNTRRIALALNKLAKLSVDSKTAPQGHNRISIPATTVPEHH